MFNLSANSKRRLVDVHPDLVKVITLGLEYSDVDYAITEGLRSLDRQKELVAKGFSHTLHSQHLKQSDGYGHAVDVTAVGDLNGDGTIDPQDKALTWDKDLYGKIAIAIKKAAKELDIGIRWGGDFKTHNGKPFFDGPHFELWTA